MNRRRTSDTLQDVICQMTLQFNPFPLTRADLQNDSTLVALGEKLSEGAFGSVYYVTSFGGKNTIIKISKKDDDPNELLRETVFNFRIVNDFIIRGLQHLVPSYGFILCDKNSAEQICITNQGYPWLFLVQRKIVNSITLLTALRLKKKADGVILDDRGIVKELYQRIGIMTVERLKRILSHLLSTLIVMQESEYQVCHHDLNANNILLSVDDKGTIDCTIIDWGKVSFTYETVRYNSDLDSAYTGKDLSVTGANDILFLLNMIYSFSSSVEIKDWAHVMLDQVFRDRFYIKEGGSDKAFTYITIEPFLFNNLVMFESSARLHIHNLSQLNQLTYRTICNIMRIPILAFALTKSIFDEPALLLEDEAKVEVPVLEAPVLEAPVLAAPVLAASKKFISFVPKGFDNALRENKAAHEAFQEAKALEAAKALEKATKEARMIEEGQRLARQAHAAYDAREAVHWESPNQSFFDILPQHARPKPNWDEYEAFGIKMRRKKQSRNRNRNKKRKQTQHRRR